MNRLLPALLCVVVCCTLSLADEPSYQGKTLSEWTGLLQKGNNGEREDAAKAMGHLGAAAVEPLLGAMDDPSAFVRVAASEAFDSLGAVALGRAVELVASATVRDRHHGAVILGRIGPAAAAHVPTLLKLMEDEDRDVQSAAIAALGRIGPKAATAVPRLVEFCAQRDRREMYARRALGRIGEASLNPLLEAFLAPGASEKSREGVCVALAELGEVAKPAVSVLIPELEHPNKDIRRAVAFALGETRAPEAVGPLMKLLRRERTPTFAAAALGEIGLPAVGPLQGALKDTQLARWAAYSLWEVARKGTPIDSCFPRLLELLAKDQKKFTRAAAANALGSGHATVAVPALISLAEENQVVSSAAAVTALGEIGDPKAIPQLTEILKQPKHYGYDEVGLALGKFKAFSSLVLPPLLEGLGSKNGKVRQACVDGLHTLGSLAKAALPALYKLSESDEDRAVRSRASWAIRQIESSKE